MISMSHLKEIEQPNLNSKDATWPVRAVAPRRIDVRTSISICRDLMHVHLCSHFYFALKP